MNGKNVKYETIIIEGLWSFNWTDIYEFFRYEKSLDLELVLDI